MPCKNFWAEGYCIRGQKFLFLWGLSVFPHSVYSLYKIQTQQSIYGIKLNPLELLLRWVRLSQLSSCKLLTIQPLIDIQCKSFVASTSQF